MKNLEKAKRKENLNRGIDGVITKKRIQIIDLYNHAEFSIPCIYFQSGKNWIFFISVYTPI